MSDNFPTFRRFGRWWWRGTCRFVRRLPLILLVLLVVLGTPWTVLNVKYGRELERELAALKAAGKPLTLVEATTRTVPEDQNAAPIYQRVLNVQWLKTGKGMSSPGGMAGVTREQSVAIEEFLKEEEPLPRFRSAVLHGPPLEPVVAKLRQASELPHAVFPINWEDGPGAFFPHLSRFRESARLLAFYAQFTAIEGRGDEALDTLGIAVRMAGHASEDPTLISQLVGYAMDAIVFQSAQHCLNTAAASQEAMQRLYETLRQREHRPAFVRSMEAERTMGLDLFGTPHLLIEVLPAMLGDYRDAGFKALAMLYVSPLAAPLRRADELYYLRTMMAAIQQAELPYREVGSRTHVPLPRSLFLGDDIAPSAERVVPPAFCLLSRALIPVFGRASQKCDWAMAQNGLLQTALALKTYRREHGSYPETLTGLPWAVPEDPFSGRPFIYRRQGAGFRLYSLGPDLEDNKGQPILFGLRRTEPAKSPSGWDGDVVWVSQR
jgi:hypothetical protein